MILFCTWFLIQIIKVLHIFSFFRVQTAGCRPETRWAKFGSEVAIKKFDKTSFYAKVKDKYLPPEKLEQELEQLCRKAFMKEEEMLSR
jgi:hypothetical protein